MAATAGHALRCSFVIPTLNEARVIGPLLQHLAEAFPECERIVSDGGSTDDTLALAAPLAHHWVTGQPGRALQMNAGAAVAGGDYLCFLHADCCPQFTQTDWFAWLASQPDWGFCPVRLKGDDWRLSVVAWFMNHRSRLSGIGTGDQLQWLRRDLFIRVGGFPVQPLMEDIELCRRLRDCHPPQVPDLIVQASGRRWEQRGWWRTVLLMWRLRAAYALGASPAELHRRYYGR